MNNVTQLPASASANPIDALLALLARDAARRAEIPPPPFANVAEQRAAILGMRAAMREEPTTFCSVHGDLASGDYAGIDCCRRYSGCEHSTLDWAGECIENAIAELGGAEHRVVQRARLAKCRMMNAQARADRDAEVRCERTAGEG